MGAIVLPAKIYLQQEFDTNRSDVTLQYPTGCTLLVGSIPPKEFILEQLAIGQNMAFAWSGPKRRDISKTANVILIYLL